MAPLLLLVLVIGVVLGSSLGLAAMTQLRKAVLTECLRAMLPKFVFACLAATAFVASGQSFIGWTIRRSS
jgi:hypothetical protein